MLKQKNVSSFGYIAFLILGFKLSEQFSDGIGLTHRLLLLDRVFVSMLSKC